MNESLKSMTKEERLKYYQTEKENKLKELSEKFLESVNRREGQSLEDLIKKRETILKSIAVKDGYISSHEVKKYLLEHYE